MQCSDDDNCVQFEYIGSEDKEDGGTVDEHSANRKVESAVKGFCFDGKLREILNDPNCKHRCRVSGPEQDMPD